MINANNAAKRAREDKVTPQTTTPAPKYRNPRKPLTEIGSNVRIFDLRDPVHTWNSEVEEDKEQAAARRPKDARAKKLRARQRSVRRGETPPPLTPSQAGPFSPPGRHPPAPASPLRRGISRPAPNARHFTYFVCCAERSIEVLINHGTDDDAVCIYCFQLLADGNSTLNGVLIADLNAIQISFSLHRAYSGHVVIVDCRVESLKPVNPVNLPLHLLIANVPKRPPTPLPIDPLQVSALSEREWGFIQNFNQAIDAIALEECFHCNKRWFNLDVQSGACKACRKKTGEVSTVFGADNHADVGFVPAHLPVLNDVEEMLIARHTHLQVRQVKGQQYRYTGHTVHFMQDTVKV